MHPQPTPATRLLHERALAHNWDDGIALPQAILDDPAVDRGTVFLLLWRSFSPLDELESDGADAGRWLENVRQFAKAATNQLRSGNFGSEAIRVDLRDDLHLNRLRVERLRRAGVDEMLLGPTPGVPFS